MKQLYKTHLPALLLLLWASIFGMQAQSPSPSYTLQGDESGASKAYVARDFVSLKPGFRYAAANGTTFNAKIDRSLLFPPTDATYLKPDGTTTSDPSQGVAVGSIPGQFGVSAGGVATYSIPIEVPPGVGGMQPGISLAYNSQGGNGIAGWGWNIGGLSAISRTGKTIRLDGSESGVTWDSGCPLALDGQRLIRIQQWGNDSVEYRTENESYSRIVGYNIQSWGPQYFKVYPKSGGVMTYGDPQSLASYAPVYAHAATDAPAGTNYERTGWNLVEVQDNNGNYIRFEYAASVDSHAGNVVRGIHYGGNKNTAAGAAIAVTFNYEKRPDDMQAYVSGKEELQQLRLTQVVTSVNNAVQNTYTLNYTGGNTSRLGFFELARNGHRVFNPLAFVYGETKKAETETTIYCNSDGGFSAMDLDGDGVDEIVNIYSAQMADSTVCYAMPIRKFSPPQRPDLVIWRPEPTNPTFPISVTNKNLNRGMDGAFGDFNGNGTSESVFFRMQGGNLAATVTDRKDNSVLFDSIIGACSTVPLKATGNFYGNPLSGTLVVFDTPVLDAITNMYKYPYCIVAGQLNGTVSRLPSGSTNFYYLSVPQKIESLSPANLNGHNLRADLWLNYTDGTNAILKNSYAPDACFPGGSASLVPLPFNIGKDEPYTIADMNRDGLPDVLHRNASGWQTAYNKGDYQFADAALPIDCGVFRGYSSSVSDKNPVVLAPEQDNIMAADINNDGLPDIVVGDESLAILGHDYAQISSGGYFVEVSHDDLANITWQVYQNTVNGYQLVATVSRNYISGLASGYTMMGNSVYYIKVVQNDAANLTWEMYKKTDTGYELHHTFSNKDYTSPGTNYVYGPGADIRITATYYGFANTTWRVYLNTGAGFTLDRSFTNSQRSSSSCLVDFQGTGNPCWVHTGTSGSTVATDFGYGISPNTLTKVSDSFRPDLLVRYKPQSAFTEYDNLKDEQDQSYTAGDYLALGFQPFRTSSMMLVSRVENGLASTTYHYGTALTSWQARGFVGFRFTGTDNELTGESSFTYNKLYPGQYLMLPSRSVSSMGVTVSAGQISLTNPIGRNDYAYTVSTLANVRYKVQQTGQSSYDYLTQKTHTVALEYDAYGNTTRVLKSFGDNVTEEQRVHYIAKGAWCANKADTVTVTRGNAHSAGGEMPAHVRRASYAYDGRGNLTAETADPGDANSLATQYSNFDAFGHPLTVAVTANGTTRTSSVAYTPSGRFVQGKTDPLGISVTYSWDEARGLLNSETGVLGTTTYSYDGNNLPAATTTPDGLRATSVLLWATPGNSLGALFYKYSEASGGAPAYTWYDAYGREIRRESFGLNNRKVAVTTQYNARGMVDRVSEPFFEADEASKKWASTYAYDAYNRVDSLTTPDGVTSYTYGQDHTKVASPSDVATTSFNAAGQTTSASKNGKTVAYDYYPSGQLMAATPQGGQAVRLWYDLQGNRTRLADPDAGTVTTAYNGFGELLWQHQKVHDGADSTSTVNAYLPGGLLGSVTRTTGAASESVVYTYDAANHYRLDNVELAGKDKVKLTYGGFDRVVRQDETVTGRTFTTRVEYDALGRAAKYYYPSGFYTENHYDAYGNLTEVTDQAGRSIGKTVEENALGQPLKVNRGGKETTFGYDDRHRLTAIAAPGVQDLSYGFDARGNTQYRQDNLTGQKEQFAYDGLNRLTSWDVYRNGALAKQNGIAYDATTSNIGSRTDLGNAVLTYGGPRPHALTGISPVPAGFPATDLNITYTDFNKVATLTEGTRNYALTYGVDDQRRKAVYKEGGATKLTRYYLGNYEEEIASNGSVRKIHYLSGGAVLVQDNGVDSLLYAYTDNQGSLTALTDAGGNVLQKYAYDPWGARRNPDDWTQKDSRTSWILNRGYTGHEHLDAFGVINMNGRVYDPATGMFLSPDPELQAPGDWLNYNRYSYCFGNPMRYVDPSGYQTTWIWNLPSQKTPTEDEQLAQWAQAWRQYYAMQDVMRSIQEQMRQSNMYVSGPPMGYQPETETGVDKFWAEHGYVRNAAGVYTMLPGYGDPRYGYWETTTTTTIRFQSVHIEDPVTHEVLSPYYYSVRDVEITASTRYVYDQTAGQNGAGGWMSDFGKANAIAGLMFSAMEYTPGSFRIAKGSALSLHYYASGWTGGSPARITTYNIGKMGKGLGVAGAILGTVVDGIGVYNWTQNPNSENAVSPGKFTLNAGMTAYGIWVNPIAPLVYSLVDAYYPGGWPGYFQDSYDLNQRTHATDNPYTPNFNFPHGL